MIKRAGQDFAMYDLLEGYSFQGTLIKVDLDLGTFEEKDEEDELFDFL